MGTALCATSLRTPEDDLSPPSTGSDHLLPEVWCTVLERGHYYVRAATAASPGQQWVIKGTDTMLAQGTALSGAIGDPTTPQKVLKGVLELGDQAPARALAQITWGRASYYLGLAMLSLSQWIKRRWLSTGTMPWIWAITSDHTQVNAGTDTRKEPPPPGHNTPSPAGTAPSTGSSGQPYSTLYPPPAKRCTKYEHSSAKSSPTEDEDGKPLLLTSRPTGDHTSAPLQADTYANTMHVNPAPHPLPLPPHSPTSGPHTPTIARSPGSCDTASPPPDHPHTPATDPPPEGASPPPTPGNPHTPTVKSPMLNGKPCPAK